MSTVVFAGLGGNIGDSVQVLLSALEAIEGLEEVENLQSSPFYRTSPVSDIPQNPYVNAVCRFETKRTAMSLWEELQKVEKFLGKLPKAKNAPRILDIDLLFFGQGFCNTHDLCLPHPRWKERLFVLKPLSDLVETLCVSDEKGVLHEYYLPNLLADFPNAHGETVEELPFCITFA